MGHADRELCSLYSRFCAQGVRIHWGAISKHKQLGWKPGGNHVVELGGKVNKNVFLPFPATGSWLPLGQDLSFRPIFLIYHRSRPFSWVSDLYSTCSNTGLKGFIVSSWWANVYYNQFQNDWSILKPVFQTNVPKTETTYIIQTIVSHQYC